MANYRRAARHAAQRHGLDPDVFERQIQQESGFNPNARSPAGAQGIAQIMPATARGWGVNPSDPIASLDAAAKNMRRYVDQYGSYRNALVAYNAGPGRVGGALPAETQNYIRTILGGRTPSVRSGGSSATTPEAASTQQQVVATALSASRPQPTITAPSLPQNITPQGYMPVETSEPTDGQSDLQKQIASLKLQTTTSELPTSQTPDQPLTGGSVHSPVGGGGKVIGTPYAGTHTLGNWQSDNAVDISVPEGTPMVALQSGTVVKVRHHPQDGGRFAGDQITIRGANGNEYFYAHGIARVKPGQRIKAGQRLGVTGSANGVPHLHFGQRKGDPRKHT